MNKKRSCLSVVIAARNEEAGIESCLRSLLEQKGVGEIIVVDDHSSDRTSDIICAIASEHDALRLISASELPNGWTGKTHALNIGATVTQYEYILFTDADVVFSGSIISDTLQKMETEKLDFIGGLFGIRCDTKAEKICAPVLAAMSWISMTLTSGLLGSGTGAFNLVRKSVYIASGGHIAIRDRIVDDVALARLMRTNSKRTFFMPRTSRYLQVRLFEGWCGYWRAITRSAIPFLGGNRFFAFLMAIPFFLLSIGLCILPPLAMWNLFIATVHSENTAYVISGLQLLLFFLGAVLVDAARGYRAESSLWTLFYPIPFTIMVLAVLYSAFNMTNKTKIIWRGREYQIK